MSHTSDFSVHVSPRIKLGNNFNSDRLNRQYKTFSSLYLFEASNWHFSLIMVKKEEAIVFIFNVLAVQWNQLYKYAIMNVIDS